MQKIPCDASQVPTVSWEFQTDGYLYSSIQAYDVDKNGKLEAFAGSADRNLYCLSSNGTLLWNYTTDPNQVLPTEGVSTTTTLADVDTDGQMDVLFGALDGRIYVLNACNGSLLWRKKVGGIISESAPAVGRLPSGDVVIVVGSDMGIVGLEGKDGGLLWNFTERGSVANAPAIADVDGDGDREVVFGTGEDYVCALNLESGQEKWATLLYGHGSYVWCDSAVLDTDEVAGLEVYVMTFAGQLYRLNGVDGQKMLIDTLSQGWSSPVLVDVHGDSLLDLIAVGYRGDLKCYDALNASVLWQQLLDGDVNIVPAVADIDLDGSLEVVVATTSKIDGHIFCFDARSGTQEWSIHHGGSGLASPLIADIDRDATQELLVASSDSVVCFDCEIENSYAYPWPWVGQRGGAGSVGEWTDSDEDHLPDTYEAFTGTSPLSQDSDSDGFADGAEFAHSTNPLFDDTDIDGMSDSWEIAMGLDPLWPGDAVLDPDADGLANLQEFLAGTDPHEADTDSDSLSDYEEAIVYGTNPLSNDTDQDGFLDAFEIEMGCNPLVPDLLCHYAPLLLYGSSGVLIVTAMVVGYWMRYKRSRK